MRGIQKAFSRRAGAARRLIWICGRVKSSPSSAKMGRGKARSSKVLAGAHHPDAGSIFIQGRNAKIQIPPPRNGSETGRSFNQEFNLIPGLSARENIFLGREQTAGGLSAGPMNDARRANFSKRLGVDIDPEMPCQGLSVAHQQVVEIAKALSLRVRILVWTSRARR